VLDDASYHKCIIKPVLRKSWKKERIFRWLVENGIPWGTDTKKKTLLQLAAVTKAKVTYAATTIAVEYGHKLFYTPPYHPEPQPIEMIWGVVKNRVAVEPATSMIDLKKKFGVSLSKFQVLERTTRFSRKRTRTW
jgi:transposase